MATYVCTQIALHLPDLVPVSEQVQLSLGCRLGIEDMCILSLLQSIFTDTIGPQELLVCHTEGLPYHHGNMTGLNKKERWAQNQMVHTCPQQMMGMT